LPDIKHVQRNKSHTKQGGLLICYLSSVIDVHDVDDEEGQDMKVMMMMMIDD